jgi:hypothetical protein
MFFAFAFIVLALHPAGLFAILGFLMIGMAFTHSVGVQYKSQEGTIANTTDSFNGNAEEGMDVAVPANTVDQVEALAITVANIVSLCLFSAVALTVKTYAAGVLKQTINLPAGKQLVRNNTSSFANPLTDNFDTMKLSNADLVKATTFKARFLLSD